MLQKMQIEWVTDQTAPDLVPHSCPDLTVRKLRMVMVYREQEKDGFIFTGFHEFSERYGLKRWSEKLF